MIGFDYGTSNCAVGVMSGNKPQILSLSGHGQYIPSTLYAPSREVIVPWLAQQLTENAQIEYKKQRQLALQKSQNILRELKLDGIPTHLSFGKEALSRYLEEPEEGYYIKSPKSFLGASGLLPAQINLFEDIVAAMMSNVKKLAEQSLNKPLTQTVIGRPINFQGLKGEESNRQAIEVLTRAAKRVGFKDVEFQFEPVAAGFEFESTLVDEKRVLVVDIGGGTTDCSMILMSPKFTSSIDRSSHLLSHSGVRIGGNDFDIQLALQGIMPSLGMRSVMKNGKPMPVNSFNQAVSINNINEQTEFYSQENKRFLVSLQRDCQEPEMFSRLLKLHEQKLSYGVVNKAEQAKIALSQSTETQIELSELESELCVNATRELMQKSSERLLDEIAKLINSAIEQADTQPDVVFVTGGSAKSPVLNRFLTEKFPEIPVVVGDHFGSVTSGLTRWAQRIFS